MKILLLILAVLLSSVTSKATDVVLPDTPNVGDTTTITTVTSGNPVTTGNLISQDFVYGTWYGSIFPDSSALNESTYLTGKAGQYARDYYKLKRFFNTTRIKIRFYF